MKSISLLIVLGLATSSMAIAQDVPNASSSPSAAPAAPQARPLRAPNMPNPRGTDSGAGPACNQLTRYGEVQPAGPPATIYGAGAPVAAAAISTGPIAAAAPARTGSSTLGAAGIATRGTVIPDAPRLNYKFVESPQPPQGTIGFANVNGVGLLKNGNLIVNQRMPMFQILEYSPDNRLIRNIDPNLVSRPHGMRVDADDNIWITDQQCSTVVKVRPTGEVLMTLGTSGKVGTWDEAKGDHLFNQPTDVAFAQNGDIFVSTGHGGPDPRVVRFDKTGKFITTWSLKHADGSSATIHTIVVNKKGEVWVGDREVKIMRIFDVNGKPLREIQMKNLICGLFIDKQNRLWMTTGQDGMIMQLDWNGNIQGWVGQEGFAADEFGEAHYMTMSPDGKTIYVGDTVNNDIKKMQLAN